MALPLAIGGGVLAWETVAVWLGIGTARAVIGKVASDHMDKRKQNKGGSNMILTQAQRNALGGYGGKQYEYGKGTYTPPFNPNSINAGAYRTKRPPQTWGAVLNALTGQPAIGTKTDKDITEKNRKIALPAFMANMPWWMLLLLLLIAVFVLYKVIQ